MKVSGLRLNTVCRDSHIAMSQYRLGFNIALQTKRVGGRALNISPPYRQGRSVAALPETISHSGTIREGSPALDEAFNMG